ncbi:MAG: 2-C-methyl-D-erythritol 4-phosphate cytidylyltransferase [Candidatus Eisenbacteria bacterium]|nr:2-C-methyl-D-erythritol 4-phosphate cytidylyltransferase [Candidatus Eisenbacteria bacterium]
MPPPVSPGKVTPWASAARFGGGKTAVTAILVAAGAGKRLGRRGDKAFATVGGMPLISYSLLALEKAREVEGIVVVVRRAAVGRCLALVRRLGLRKVVTVAAGGRRRQDSVLRGLGFAAGSEYVLVHDAARPFLSAGLVSRTVAECRRTGAAIAAEPASDTVKKVKAGRVAGTVPRQTLWLAQTPQAFRRNLLERAFHEWPSRLDATDDAALLERAGVRVAVVQGDPFNIKITYPADVALAEAVIEAARKVGGKGVGRRTSSGKGLRKTSRAARGSTTTRGSTVTRSSTVVRSSPGRTSRKAGTSRRSSRSGGSSKPRRPGGRP